MMFQITQICFNESDHVMLHAVKSIMAENDARMTHKLPHY